MKTKTKSSKKPAAKKKSPAKRKVVKEFIVVVRQVNPKPLATGTKHVMRLVENCSPRLLTFNSTVELNTWLFEFDVANQGKNPDDTGTWVDHIFLDVQGDIFDMDNLEQEFPEET